MVTDSRELDFRALLRALRERVVDATGLVEDGSALGAWGTVLDRNIEPDSLRDSSGLAPLPRGARDHLARHRGGGARAGLDRSAGPLADHDSHLAAREAGRRRRGDGLQVVAAGRLSVARDHLRAVLVRAADHAGPRAGLGHAARVAAARGRHRPGLSIGLRPGRHHAAHRARRRRRGARARHRRLRGRRARGRQPRLPPAVHASGAAPGRVSAWCGATGASRSGAPRAATCASSIRRCRSACSRVACWAARASLPASHGFARATKTRWPSRCPARRSTSEPPQIWRPGAQSLLADGGVERELLG